MTFFFHVIDDSSLIPMSIIEVLSAAIAAPTAAPRNGTRKRKSQKHPPEGAAKCPLLPGVVQLTRLRLLPPRLRADQSRVIDSDVTLRLQRIQSFDGCFGVVNTGEGPRGQCRHKAP